MDSNNPYQAPPDDLGLVANSKPDLAYWVYAYTACKLIGVLLVGAVTWYAQTTTSPHTPDGIGWQLWCMLGWFVLGGIAAAGVSFRIPLAKQLLVVHLLCTAVMELYAFVSMMQLNGADHVQQMAFDYGWTYFAMALWDLGWATMFHFSPSLRAALR